MGRWPVPQLAVLVVLAVLVWLAVVVRGERRQGPAPPVFGEDMQGEWWAAAADGAVLFVIGEQGGWCAREVRGHIDVYEMRAISRSGHYENGVWRGNIQLDVRGGEPADGQRGTLRENVDGLSLSRLVPDGPERGFGAPFDLRRVQEDGRGAADRLLRAIEDVRVRR